MSRKTIPIAELIQRIEFAGRGVPHDSSETQRIFIASFCGTLLTQYPAVARALANAAGMGHLCAEQVSK